MRLLFIQYFKLTYILGISSFYHDSGASLIKDGEIIACAQEERFTRKKHDSSFPTNSINFCLRFSNIHLRDVDYIVFYEKPFLKFERLLETYIAYFPWGLKSFIHSFPIWIKEKLFQKRLIIDELKKIDKNFSSEKLKFSEHHLSHASSAYFPSPFEEAIILTLDGVGEWTTSSVSLGNKNNIKILKEIHFPHSLGLLYSAFTNFLGFKVNSGEYKVMGLAPYGKPKYFEKIVENIIHIKQDGSFFLDQSYFDYATGLKMISKKFENLFNNKARKPEDNIDQFHMDIAASIQKVTEEIVIKICLNLYEKYKVENICLAGGVALNCVANGKILTKTPFKNIWIQPAAGDAGGSLGAALGYWYLVLKNNRSINNNDDAMKGSYLGPSYNEKDIEKSLKSLNAVYKKLDYNEMIEFASTALKNDQSIGWFQGRMEFGPRALGGRSIIADPRDKTTQEKLNLKIKFRESFRPFAPAILEEKISDYYENKSLSPYMLLIDYLIKDRRYEDNQKLIDEKVGIEKLKVERSEIPSVTHLDYSARIQTVNGKYNKPFYDLIKSFYKKTGCPILINTSFNVRGEPIVCTIEDAFKCFMGTNLDILICESFILKKKDQIVSQNESFYLDFKKD